MIKTFLNPEGHHNCLVGSKVTVILLKDGFSLLVELQREGSAINGATPSSYIQCQLSEEKYTQRDIEVESLDNFGFFKFYNFCFLQ